MTYDINMGLREKALNYADKVTSEDHEKIRPSLKAADTDNIEDWEQESLSQFKAGGRVDRKSLLEEGPAGMKAGDDPYLFSDRDIHPNEIHLARQARIEHLLNLLELIRDLADTRDEDDLWTNILFGISGQVGARETAVFYLEDGRYTLMQSRGFLLEERFRLSCRSRLVKRLSEDTSIRYSRELEELLAGEEKEWLKALKAELVVPIVTFSELNGFILLGPPLAHGDYSLDDLLYLKLAGEVFGSFRNLLDNLTAARREREKWQQREERLVAYRQYIEAVQQKHSRDDMVTLTRELLTEKFNLNAFIFLEKHGGHFEPVLYRGLSDKTVGNMNGIGAEGWIYSFTGPGRNHYSEISSISEIYDRLSREEASVFDSFDIWPFFLKKSVTGLLVVFRMQKEASEDEPEFLSSVMHTFFLHNISEHLLNVGEKTEQIHSDDPLYSLKNLIQRKETLLNERKEPFSLLFMAIDNADRLRNILGADLAGSLIAELEQMVQTLLPAGSEMFTPFSERILMVLPGYERAATWKLSKTIQKEISTVFPDDELKPLLRFRMVSRPSQNAADIEELLLKNTP